MLNSSQVVVALREGEATPIPVAQDRQGGPSDPYGLRHARTTSRLFSFIGALSEELEQANGKLRYQAEHDVLTGARNHRVLYNTLELEIARATRYDRPFALVMFDLDHFKDFNDRFGHTAGDVVLSSVSAAVGGTLREIDILVRYGGEEFMVLLPETHLAGAAELAEKLRKKIEGLSLHLECTTLPALTSSFGVACFPEHGSDGEALIKAVDAAMYRAKEGGRNRVVA